MIPRRIDRTILRASVAKCDQITAELREYEAKQDKAANDWQNIHDYLDDVRRTKGKPYEAEMVLERCKDAETLTNILYELADRGHDLTHSATFQALLEKAGAEDIGL